MQRDGIVKGIGDLIRRSRRRLFCGRIAPMA